MPSFVTPLLHKSSHFFQLQNARTGVVLAAHVMTAFHSAARNKGLQGRDGLPEGSALVIAPTNAIHTFFMKFPIDVLFITKDGRVVKIKHGLKPWRVASCFLAYAVVELPAGATARSKTATQDMLVIKDASGDAHVAV